MASASDLEDAVFFAFRQAYAQQRLDVAELLLQALELLARDEKDERLADAYRLIQKADRR
ncbi:hypothetical protein BFL28_11690 [Sphingomonas turrisvirgatae]|jgi:hypothetical protein|uniref:Uncharacterized protein n=1 Tax=Sphingomonas turrisvirgatae TaxID=1888892 RepID=A0A1E3LZK3_9SPHN|nr:hypothetical protein BFL28_11690 [Sphingomonas turrisvirgatae]